MPTFLACSQWLNCGGNREVKSDVCILKAHSCSHFSPCFDHTSPTQTDDGTSQIDHDIGATSPSLFEQCHGFFYVPFQLKYKDEGDKANGLTLSPNDAIIWTEKGVSQLA